MTDPKPILAYETQSPRERELFVWMFSFLRPVRLQVALAGAFLAVLCGVEILTVNQSGWAIDDIKALQAGPQNVHTLFDWLAATDAPSVALRQTIIGFVILTAA